MQEVARLETMSKDSGIEHFFSVKIANNVPFSHNFYLDSILPSRKEEPLEPNAIGIRVGISQVFYFFAHHALSLPVLSSLFQGA